MVKKRAHNRKPKFEHIWIELYGSNIYYVKCTRGRYEELVKEHFDKIPPEKDFSVTGTAEGYEKKNRIVDVVWINSGCLKRHRVGVLSHECFHVVHNIMQRAGVWLTDSSEEAYTYLLQYIINEIGKF